jgi:hypothetical protein
MNAAADTLLKNAENEVQTARPDEAQPDAQLVEMGKVSDTKGGWIGSKTDVGVGFVYY